MKNKCLFILFFFIAICSCTKYEEGPFLTFRNAANRLKGTWSLTKYLNNGIDSTNIKLANSNFLYKITFAENYNYDELHIDLQNKKGERYRDIEDWTQYIYHRSGGAYYKISIERHDNVDENLALISFPPFDTTHAYNNSMWQIIRLTKDELKVRHIDENYQLTQLYITYEK